MHPMIRTTFAALIALGAALALLQGGNAATAPSPADQPQISQTLSVLQQTCVGPIERRVNKYDERVDQLRWGDSEVRWGVLVRQRWDCDGQVRRFNTFEWLLPEDVPSVITPTTPPHCSHIRTNLSWGYDRDDDGSLTAEATAHGSAYQFRLRWTNGCGEAISSSSRTWCASGITRRTVAILDRTITSDNRMLYKVWLNDSFSPPGYGCPLTIAHGFWAYDPPEPIPAPAN